MASAEFGADSRPEAGSLFRVVDPSGSTIRMVACGGFFRVAGGGIGRRARRWVARASVARSVRDRRPVLPLLAGWTHLDESRDGLGEEGVECRVSGFGFQVSGFGQG